MLRLRIITALILAPLAVAAVFYLPPLYFALLFWVIAALALYEWAGLLTTSMPLRMGYLVVYALLAVTVQQSPQIHVPLLQLGCVLWLGAIAAVLVYPRGAGFIKQPVTLAVLGWLVGTVAWLAITRIDTAPQGNYWIVWMFALVWGADVGAYFAGKAFGRHTLAPQVSPGKTWEGALGGILLAGSVCGVIAYFWQVQGLLWVALTLMLIVVSIFGDLFESLLKRSTGVKDSGTLLPGHGGMLDRIDSILAVLPVLALILLTTPAAQMNSVS